MIRVSTIHISQSLAFPTLVIVAGIWLSLFRVNLVVAQTQQTGEKLTTERIQDPPYQQYEVKAGETLYSISKSLNVEIEDLKKWNSLASNALSIGQVLDYIPKDWSPSTSENEGSVDELGTSIIRTTDIETTEFYIVKSGDNLIRIAGAHDMTVNELKSLNGLESDFIRVGQRLTVKKVVDSVAPVAANFEEGSAPQGAYLIYTVPTNPTLDSILINFQMSRKEMAYLNPDVNIDQLDPGQKITILAPPSREYANPYTSSASITDIGQVVVNVYEESEKANTTTTGELYNPDDLTAAHASIRLGQVLYVENPSNNRGIYIRINDRTTENVLKLSRLAYQLLGYDEPSSKVTNADVTSHTKGARIFTLEEL